MVRARWSVRNLVIPVAMVAVAGSSFAVAYRGSSAPSKPASLAAGTEVAAGPAHSDVAAVAMQVARDTHALPTRDGAYGDATRYCESSRMTVLWSKPDGKYRYGGFIEPLGPAPGPSTTSVNGVVVCAGSLYAYMGFEATKTSDGWEVVPVPDVTNDDASKPVPEVSPSAGSGSSGGSSSSSGSSPVIKVTPGLVSLKAALFTVAIEPLAAYDPQSTCDPTAKPGVVAFRAMMLATFPGTRNLGIITSCSSGSISEHKDGRAFDWGVRVDVSKERTEAETVLTWLLATDRFGNEAAMARRLGIMYMIWNHRIWGAYRAAEGWRAYSGSSPHTDHIHFSFAWAGARKLTSFWTGKVASMPGSGSGRGGNGVQLIAYKPTGDSNGTRLHQSPTGTVRNPSQTDRTKRTVDWTHWPHPTPTWTYSPHPAPTWTYSPHPTPTSTYSPRPAPTWTYSPHPAPTWTPRPSGTPSPSVTPSSSSSPGSWYPSPHHTHHH